MRESKARKMAREVAALLTDGRPRGCKCPPDPSFNTLPADNRHIDSPRCPLTSRTASEMQDLRNRVDNLTLALDVLVNSQPQPGPDPQPTRSTP